MPRFFYTVILIGITTILLVVSLGNISPKQPVAEFGGVSLNIEYATTTEAQQRGLGGRATVPNDYGMLFVFARDDRYGIWMKGMLVPIDVFWLDDQKRVVASALEVATSTFPTIFYPNIPARYVLETASGFGRAHNIATGIPLLLKSP